jgi:hypothetical protein
MTVDNSYDHYYTLSTIIDGVNYYYVEDESGNGSIEEGIAEEYFGRTVYTAPVNAMKYDAEDIYNISVKHNTIFVESRIGDNSTETKIVDGEEIIFTRNVGSYKSVAEMIESGATLEAGYNLTSAGADKWSWSMRYQSGWTTLTPQPTGLPYEEQNYPYGYESGSQNEAYTAIANGTPDSGIK